MNILVCGPESSGKSTMANFLSKQKGYVLLEEYARMYLTTKPKDFTYQFIDIFTIYKEQNERYYNHFMDDNALVLDTDLINLKFWAEEKFGEVIPGLRKALYRRQYDEIFLCKPDFPWQADPLRENPNDRNRLFFRYQKILEALKLDYVVLKGSLEERKDLVVQKINSRLG